MEFVLGVFDNDENKSLKCLRQEQDFIEKTLFPLKINEELNFDAKYNLGMEGLIDWISKYRDKMNWFHFSGHHNKGGIKLKDGDFGSLATNLVECKNLKGIFINGCGSKETLEKLADRIPICIGTTKPIYDGVAEKFSTMFYRELNTLDKWNDYDEFHQIFKRVAENTHTLLKAKEIDDTTRGGGLIKDFEDNFYFITDKSEERSNQFRQRTITFYDNKIKQYNINEHLNELFSELGKEKFPETYFKEPPFFLGNFVQAFDIKSKNENYAKNRIFGSHRYRLIKNYFYTYLDLCRYSILSILWDEINDNLITTPDNEISTLLIRIKSYTLVEIKILKKLCKEILNNLNKKKEKKFVDGLLSSFEIFESGILLFERPLDSTIENKVFWESELLLHELLKKTQFLNNYNFTSVRSRHYIRHRNDEKEKYKVEYYWDKSNLEYDEEFVDIKFVNIHSIYLCQKEQKKDMVINLSPFYFDKNSYDPTADKILLYILDSKNINKKGNLEFVYIPVINPGINSDENIKIHVCESSAKTKVDSKEKKDAVGYLGSRNLFSQLSFFINSLLTADEQ